MISINYLFEQNDFILYCDMDGVLTDFDSRAREVGYKGPLGYGKYGKDLWKIVIARGVPFWSKMKWLKDGKKLWDYIEKYNPVILSSVGNSLISKLGRNGTQGKKEWLKRELGQKFADKALITAGKKYKFAKSNAILIDDSEKHIKEFKENSGQAILHKSADETIKQLKKLGL